MHITLIVGNGFDLSLGLPTGYQDFYHWWMENETSKNDNIKLMKENIQCNKNEWADYELGIGQFVSEFKKSRELLLIFADWKKDANQALIDYFKTLDISGKIRDKIKKEQIIRKCSESLLSFFWGQKGLNPQFRDKNDADHSKIILHFISLNYTDSLDQIASGIREYLGKSGNFEIEGEVLHPHGTLKNEGSIVLGVNDTTQIHNEVIQNDDKLNWYLRKESLIEENEFCRAAKSEGIKAINQSSIVCLYGLALGKTDQSLWDLLGNWLKEDSNRRIFVPFYFKEKTNEKRIEKEEEIQKVFLPNAEKTERDIRIPVIFFERNYLFEAAIFFNLGNDISLPMIFVEAGTFTMGSDDSDAMKDETPHTVTLTKDYWFGKYEVTQEQYNAVMGRNPSDFKKGGKYPVEEVSWNDAQDFCKKLNSKLASQLPAGYEFRLPTEAEWEYAARGGKKSKGYKYSGSNDIGSVAWYDDNSGSATHPVGDKDPNELGIYDMSGNVWEWCLDCCNRNSTSYTVETDTYHNNIQDPLCTMGSGRVRRGGCWDNRARGCRVSNRGCNGPSRSYDYLGFRLVLASCR